MKKILSLCMLGILSATLVACSSSSNNKTAEQTIQVVVDTTFPPFETRNKQGELAGFDIDLANAIAEHEHLYLEFKPMQFNGIIPALQSGLAQMGLAGITITPARAQVVNFSDAYYLSGLTFIAKKGKETPIKTIQAVPDLVKGKIVATKKGSTSAAYLSKIPGIKEVLQFDNIDDAYNVMVSGGADMVLFDDPVNLSFMNKAQAGGDYEIISPLLTGEYYGIAISGKYPDLVKKINDGLNAIRQDGTYDKLYAQYFGNAESGKVKQPLTPAEIFAK